MTVLRKSRLASLESWFSHKDHPAWFSSFSEEQQEKMLAEDENAGRSVPGLLAGIISSGVVLAIITVLLLK